jgi:hypothetical protein
LNCIIFLELTSRGKKLKVVEGNTCAFFLLDSRLSGELGARFVESSNKFSNKIEWSDSTCFFIVVMPLDLWYAMGPFLHLVHMANILRGIVSLW